MAFNNTLRYLFLFHCFAMGYSFVTSKRRLEIHEKHIASLFSFPPSTNDFSLNPQPEQPQEGEDEEEPKGQANTRFSKFAPPNDPNLSADEFRSQLKENMKAELERRRREDPNRGNQPAKSYLDSL